MMLFENENLVCSEREIKIQYFIGQLMNKLYEPNETIEVNKEMLIEILSLLTSSENICSSTKTAVEALNRTTVRMYLEHENIRLKEHIKYLEDKIEELEEDKI